MRLGQTAYGVPIRKEIEQRIGRTISAGTLYKTVRRLEAKGFISSRVGEATPVRGGRAKTYYRVEELGSAALRCSVREIGMMIESLDLGWRSL